MQSTENRELAAETEAPQFTVVTVCFNSAKTIEQTIQSVRSQVNVVLEHIIIDGGSTDGTHDILEHHRQFLAKIIIERDDGIYDAMQKGLDLAKGEFVGFLNADDRFASVKALAVLAQVLRSGSWDGVTSAVAQVNDAGTVLRVMGQSEPKDEDIAWGIVPPHPGMYLRTNLARTAGGFDKRLRIVGDFDLYLRARAAAIKPFAHVSDIAVLMRVGGRSTTGLDAYLTSGREFLSVLKALGYRPNPFRIYLRVFKKVPELVKGIFASRA